MVDARSELSEARATCRMLHATGIGVPLVAVVTEAGLIALNADWGVDDVILATRRTGRGRGPAAARRWAGCPTRSAGAGGGSVRAGELNIDPDTYAAEAARAGRSTLRTRSSSCSSSSPSTRAGCSPATSCCSEVWGYDYFGGTRTVDVHVRRLRAKLGSEYESMIGTVRQVGYKFVCPAERAAASRTTSPSGGLPV